MRQMRSRVSRRKRIGRYAYDIINLLPFLFTNSYLVGDTSKLYGETVTVYVPLLESKKEASKENMES